MHLSNVLFTAYNNISAWNSRVTIGKDWYRTNKPRREVVGLASNELVSYYRFLYINN